MRNRYLFLSILFFSSAVYGQIIADHTVVDEYDNIPAQYIDSVKTMLVYMGGESHGGAYRNGPVLLENLDNTYQVLTYNDEDPPGPSNQYLRIGQLRSMGENYFFSQSVINSIKNRITTQYETGNPYDVIGFGWCYDMTWINPPGGTLDPVYNVHWAGSSDGSPDGNQRWGLDSGDSALTGNRVNMDTYLEAVEQYNQHCVENGYPTIWIYTTGPVDGESSNGTEKGFQRELKQEHIRKHVATDVSHILFDYADILCWNNDGEQNIAGWDDGGNIRLHAQIHPDNLSDYDEDWNIIYGADSDGDHIGEVGALRLAKAMWWLLARIAGWDGTVDGEDTTAPSVPSGLVLDTATETSVTFSWDASSDNVGVDNYRIYRDGVFLESTGVLSYTDYSVSACADYRYTVSAVDAVGNESAQSEALFVNPCAPDLTPTITLSPNVANGVTIFELIVRVTELNNIDTNGDIVIHIPKDQHWDLSEDYNPSLTELSGTSLNNDEWSYSEDTDNHIFTTSTTILAGSNSTFGFRISFDPGSSTGMNPITTQLISGGGGEVHVSNNSDSEQLDYFQ